MLIHHQYTAHHLVTLQTQNWTKIRKVNGRFAQKIRREEYIVVYNTHILIVPLARLIALGRYLNLANSLAVTTNALATTS